MPIGGQALNVGLSDAVNLGWKLAAVLAGWAPPGLLDSYETERHAAAARVIRHVAGQETLLLGGTEVEPLREVLSESFALDAVQQFLGRFCAGLDDRYGTGDDQCGTDDDVLTGRHMACLRPPSAPGALPADLLTGAHGGVLVRFASPRRETGHDGHGPAARSVTLASGASLRIVHATIRPPGNRITDLLLRPDAHIAWAGADRRRLSDAVRQWLGAPLPDSHLAR
jgi:hypothetical protein